MSGVAAVGALMSGIAALMWPIIILILLLVLRTQIRMIADSVGRRGGSVKLAGFEVTIAEATEQQQKLIADLQIQLGHLQDRVATTARSADDVGSDTNNPAPPSKPPIRVGASPGGDLAALISRRPQVDRQILWIDQKPADSAAVQAALADWGLRIVNVKTVDAALEYIAGRDEATVIARVSLALEADVGVKLVERARSIDPFATVIIFGTAGAVARMGHEALAAGAAFVTASPAELIRFLSRTMPDNKA